MAQISPITFSEVRLRSAADSNMAASALVRVHVRAPAAERLTGGWFWHVLNMSFTQKRPETVRNTCPRIVKLDCKDFICSVYLFIHFFAYAQSAVKSRADQWTSNVTVFMLLLSCQDCPRDSLLIVTKNEKIKNSWKRVNLWFQHEENNVSLHSKS